MRSYNNLILRNDTSLLFIDMCLLMRFKVSALRESLPALIALVWSLSSVPAQVYLKRTRSHECVAAELAAERPLPRVSPHVVCQVPLGCKGFLTVFNRTSKGLLSRVNAHVCLQVSLLCEGFPAALNLTTERLLSSLS